MQKHLGWISISLKVWKSKICFNNHYLEVYSERKLIKSPTCSILQGETKTKSLDKVRTWSNSLSGDVSCPYICSLFYNSFFFYKHVQLWNYNTPSQILPFLYLFIPNWAYWKGHLQTNVSTFLKNLSPQTTAKGSVPPLHWNCDAKVVDNRPAASLLVPDAVLPVAPSRASRLLSGFGHTSSLPPVSLIPPTCLSARLFLCLLLCADSSSLTLTSSTISTATCKLVIPSFYLLLRPLWWRPESHIPPTVWDAPCGHPKLLQTQHIKEIMCPLPL